MVEWRHSSTHFLNTFNLHTR